MKNKNDVVLKSYILNEAPPSLKDKHEEIEVKKKNLKNSKESIEDVWFRKYSSNTTIDLSEESQQLEFSITRFIKNQARKTCSVKNLKRRVPIFSYLPKYNWETALSDFLAGLTVGLTIIPQAIAYSSVAGLPAQIGLYSSFVAPFVYAIFGSSKDSPVGPTAIEGLLVREIKHELGVPGAILLCFLSGCVEFVMGLLHLGFLIDFISGPVTVAFTSAAAIIIATTQVKDLLGLDYPGDKFVLVWKQIFQHISETSVPDCVMGLICVIVLIALKKLKDIKLLTNSDEKPTKIHQFLSGLCWLLSTSRNLLVVVISASVAYGFERHNMSPFKLTGFVAPGLPSISLPPFSTQVGNKTYNFLDMASTFGSGIIIVPILSVLQNYALAKVYGEGEAIDSTQEMLALGICNIASSFVSSMPVSGALSRGAVNHASGVKTTFGGIYTAIVVILSLSFLTPWFYYIPKAALAAVIIVAVSLMIELHVFGPIWRTKRSDLIPATATFFACLFTRLEIGIGIGVTIDLAFLLYATARPSIIIEKATTPFGFHYLLVIPDRSISFPSAEYIRSVITKEGATKGLEFLPIVIDAKHIQSVDYTAAKGMKLLMRDLSKKNQPIIFTHLKKSVIETFKGVHPKNLIYCKTQDDLNEVLKAYSSETNKENTEEKNQQILTRF